MSVAHLWQAFRSMPWQAQAAAVAALVVVPAGIWTVSRSVAAALVAAAGIVAAFMQRAVERARKLRPSRPERVVTGPVPIVFDEPAWCRDDVIEAWVTAWTDGQESPAGRKDVER